jgi:THO complex subunit 4
MFQEVEQEEIYEEVQSERRGGALSIETGTKISVENLEYSVSEENLRDLFESVGAVKKVMIKYDKSGRSLGAAEITFSRKADAQSALNKYQGAKVDGKAIRLSIIGSNLPVGGRRNSNFSQNRNSQRGRRSNVETGFTVSLSGARRLRVGGNRPRFGRGGRRGNMRMDME